MASSRFRRTGWLVFVAMLIMTGGAALAASQEFPAPAELPPLESPADLALVKPWPGWQEFLGYREALRWTGGVVLGLMALLVLIHLAIYGARRVRPTGRMVSRYSWTEVFLHDVVAVTFVAAWASSTYLILAKYVSGYGEKALAVPFGRFASTVHIVSGLLFVVSLVPLAAIWWRAMRFAGYDRDWLKALGGYFSRRHQILPAGKFNAGQKMWFHVSIFLGILVAVSGALIYYPALFGVRWGILLYILHTLLAVALSAAVIVHVYLAAVARPQSAGSMITGKVDEACVREDHPLEPLPSRTRSSSLL